MRLLLSIFVLLCLQTTVYGQQPPDSIVIRQLISQAGKLILKRGELPADLNAARPILHRAAELSRKSGYKPGQARCSQLAYQLAYEAKDDDWLVKLLPEQTFLKRNTTLKYLFYRVLDRRQLDSALMFAKMMKEDAIRNQHPFLSNDAEFYLASYHIELAEWDKMAECYTNMIRFHRQQKNLADELSCWTALNFYMTENSLKVYTKEEVLKNMLSLSERLGDKRQYATTLADLGRSDITFGRMNEAEQKLLEAERILRTNGIKDRFSVYEWLCRFYIIKADVYKALQAARAAQQSRYEAGAAGDLERLYYYVAEVYQTFGLRGRAFQELNNMFGGSDPLNIRPANYKYAVVGAQLIDHRGQTRQAIAYLSQGMKDKLLFTYDHQLVTANMYMGDFYLRLKDTLTALQHYKKSEQLMDLKVWGRATGPSDLYIRLARSLYDAGRYDSALAYLQRIEKLHNGQVRLEVQIDMQQLFYRIDSLQGRYLSAMGRSHKHQALRDSIYGIERWAQLEELQMKYETAQKDQQLQQRAQQVALLTQQNFMREELLEQRDVAARQRDLLNKRNNQQAQLEARQRGDSLKNKEERIRALNKEASLQHTVLEQTRNARNALILGAVLLLLLLSLGYNRFLLKQRNNRELQLQRDVITGNNVALSKLVNEKEWLLKEVHHRVKNNLQVVMSLLNIQSFYLQDDRAIAAIRDSQRRLNAISLIHKKLYQSDNMALVDMPLYVNELVECLRESVDMPENIRIDLAVDPIMMDVKRALPVGLILNESITNAFKYAFPDNHEGTIDVSLKQEGSTLLLTIADNGIGFQPGNGGNSLGMSLMDGLARDLEGELMVDGSKGAKISVVFPVVQ
ncbi:hypothetical protein MKQ68_07555 [Chitinophaga horti]|uniref:histidine kinase n=1 Tax=Chitinophaga horti TaxID=2920382 RepID=A0ABY6J5Q9_9BACT|nr:histidine kinase dimerization/phosphoacceptor domain -containing protein [Chitinophaga horti]UYQ94948.1 hypothetical protein MKQ68_07555 [Chitinophaga horti]